MINKLFTLLFIFICISTNAQPITGSAPQIKIANGTLQGITEASGVHSFKGIPYAQPPIGNLRWKEPQPPQNWSGVRKADKFGPQPMQRYMYSDMIFRSNGKSEDCLYLNVWTPAKGSQEKLPVLVYFYGGGLVAGDGSEYRYDGESMATKGIVTVTLNYRLGIFGFLSLLALTQESPHHSSGNYGLMDQHAALLWVQKNIAAFGGDPTKVTIAGESAGSMSVCAQMASPLSKGLFRGAIAESGSLLGNLSPVPLAEAEKRGTSFTTQHKDASLADLRNISADSLLAWTANYRFPTTVDGYFLPESPKHIFETGKQMDIPLLGGWNSAEVSYHSLLGSDAPTLENYKNTVQKLYSNRADEIMRAYPVAKDSDVLQVATDLASDRFISFATWKFLDLHSKTNGYPVYRYLFTQKRPLLADSSKRSNEKLLGAVHASEIDYVLGNLHYNTFYHWTADDHKTSETMETYFANFIKTSDPNGAGLPTWYGMQSSIPKVMIIDANAHSEPEKNLKRYVLLDSFYP